MALPCAVHLAVHPVTFVFLDYTATCTDLRCHCKCAITRCSCDLSSGHRWPHLCHVVYRLSILRGRRLLLPDTWSGGPSKTSMPNRNNPKPGQLTMLQVWVVRILVGTLAVHLAFMPCSRACMLSELVSLKQYSSISLRWLAAGLLGVRVRSWKQ